MASTQCVLLSLALTLTLLSSATCARPTPGGAVSRTLLQSNACSGNPCGSDPNLVCTPGGGQYDYACTCNPGLLFVGIPNYRGRCAIGSLNLDSQESEATQGANGQWSATVQGTFTNNLDVAVKDVIVRCTPGCTAPHDLAIQQLGTSNLFSLTDSFVGLIKPGKSVGFPLLVSASNGEKPTVNLEVYSYTVDIFPVQEPAGLEEVTVTQAQTSITQDGSWDIHHVTVTLTNNLDTPVSNVVLRALGSLFPYRQYTNLQTLGTDGVTAVSSTFTTPVEPGQSVTGEYFYRSIHDFGQGPGPLPGDNATAQQLAAILVLSFRT